MVAAQEALPGRTQQLRSSMLRRPLELLSGGCRLLVEPDGSVRWLESLRERRLLFGREQVWFYKVQAGVTVQAQKPDWSLRVQPRSASMSARVFDSVEAAQTVEFLDSAKEGYTRTVKVRNLGTASAKVRVLAVWDPTAAQFRDRTFPWGSLGVNAFNRGSHVAMDEASDPPSARVVGAVPQPLRFYMTSDRSRASDSVQAGEVPEATAGVTGQALVISVHETDVQPQETKLFTFVSVYDPAKLEDALAEFARVQQGPRPRADPPRAFSCSSVPVGKAFAWARAALEGASTIRDSLDLCEALHGLQYVDPVAAQRGMQAARLRARKDGSVPHSLDPTAPGVLETAVLLSSSSQNLLLSGEKKAARGAYPYVRKAAEFLMQASADSAVRLDPGLPQGWRRRLGKGFPTGEIPEVSLAVASALSAASQVARAVSKAQDAAKFRERADMISDGVKKRLTDDRGMLALCLDSTGKLNSEETIDVAVACYRWLPQGGEPEFAAHRLLEKDFETGYGPRTVPTSNRTFFNGTYGDGQLGGLWTRAALAHAILCYHAGLAGTGSLSLERVARLVSEEGVRLGAAPGEFPEWVDVEGRESHGDGTDRVAAARFVEAIVEGEMGFSLTPSGGAFSPAQTSSLRWLAGTFWAGSKATVFVGRSSGRVTVFAAGVKQPPKVGTVLSNAEFLSTQQRDVSAVSFSGPGQVICVGNASAARQQAGVSFAPRSEDLSKKLTASLEEFDPSKETWSKVGSLKVAPSMGFDVGLGPSEWKAFRVSGL